jgi:hypothetical protein
MQLPEALESEVTTLHEIFDKRSVIAAACQEKRKT